jgi:hypothetical protein
MTKLTINDYHVSVFRGTGRIVVVHYRKIVGSYVVSEKLIDNAIANLSDKLSSGIVPAYAVMVAL